MNTTAATEINHTAHPSLAPDTATVAAGKPSREETPRRAARKGRPFFLLLGVLVLVNVSAVWGQTGWFLEHATPTHWPEMWMRWTLALVLALAVELVGVYLSAEADEARRAKSPALALQLLAYAFGCLAGWLNYQHWSGQPGASAELPIVFAALSTASPFLWAVWSKARNRAAMAEAGEAPRRGVRLSGARKVWHPIQSIRVMRWAAWEGITDEDTAVRGWSFDRYAPEIEPTSGAPAGKRSKTQWWQAALALGASEPGANLEQIAKTLDCTSRWLRMCRKEAEQEASA